MIYVFDTNSLSNILNHYYRDRFPSFWEKFDESVRNGSIVSVREGKFELEQRFSREAIEEIVRLNAEFFAEPTSEEGAFVRQIYSIPHFRQNLEHKKLLQGGYFADPFIIARARVVNGIVVTEEHMRDNGAGIPNICKHFGIEPVNLKDFLSKEDWRF